MFNVKLQAVLARSVDFIQRGPFEEDFFHPCNIALHGGAVEFSQWVVAIEGVTVPL